MQLEHSITSFHLRPIIDADMNFLSELYASTRTEEMSIIPWTENQKQLFLNQQFQAQHQFYQQQFPQAQFDLIVEDGEPIGRLYIDSREVEIRIIDIALIPEYRSKGTGGCLLNQVLETARQEQKAVRIHVEHNNPAIRLYQRLGFQQIDTNGVYYLMEWTDDK